MMYTTFQPMMNKLEDEPSAPNIIAWVREILDLPNTTHVVLPGAHMMALIDHATKE